jgi:hypothetical protein
MVYLQSFIATFRHGTGNDLSALVTDYTSVHRLGQMGKFADAAVDLPFEYSDTL